MKKEFNPTGFLWAHPHGRHDVMWKRSIASCKKKGCFRGSKQGTLICSASRYTCFWQGGTIFTVGGWGTSTLDAMVIACRSKLSKVNLFIFPWTCATLIHQLSCYFSIMLHGRNGPILDCSQSLFIYDGLRKKRDCSLSPNSVVY